MSGSSLHIGLQLMGDRDWTGGTVYLGNLLHAIRQRYPDEVEISLLAPAGRPEAEDQARRLGVRSLITYELPDRWSLRWLLDRAASRVLPVDAATARSLRRRGIDVVFGPHLLYGSGRPPTIVWLPDLQHRRLPEMFSDGARRARDREYLRRARLAARVLLMSRAVERDFAAFAPSCADKARVLHPASHIAPAVYDREPATMVEKYRLPEKFVFLPNQFWRHKNHRLAFEALALLRREGLEVSLVCTGGVRDHRNEGFFAELCGAVREMGIGEQVSSLGMVPRQDLFLLMRQSVCVVNPSLFEGWGQTMDEGRSLGKWVIASDIPAHREQGIPAEALFDPADARGLAERLAALWRQARPGPDPRLESEARRRTAQRQRAYGEGLVTLAREALGRESGRRRVAPAP